jgi:sec-independent protein translocase protein TatC
MDTHDHTDVGGRSFGQGRPERRGVDVPPPTPSAPPVGPVDGADQTAASTADRFENSSIVVHSEELVYRLSIVVLVAVGVAVFVFPFAERPIFHIWYAVLPATEVTAPHVYAPLELKFTELKFAALAGVVSALPVAAYQAYRFMRDGLYANERRYYLAAVPTTLVLATLGLAFAYFLLLPFLFAYFFSYSAQAATTAFSLGQTFDLILVVFAYMAFVFQLPLLLMGAVAMGLTTRAWLVKRRLLFWAGFFALSFVVGPDPTGMVPIVVMATMVVLFEGSLVLLRWTGN